MTRTLTLLSLAAAAALAGCGADTSDAANEASNAANAVANAEVQLPPSIAASKIYRCADNAVVYVDWLSDGKSANLRTDPSGAPTPVTAAEPGQPMTGPEGYSLQGSPTESSARIAVPGHPAQSCKA
ncbi:MAG TPA: hypothetical protein VJM15_11180 [Sphingomicrobium sp.]|nr:hypothetical protein [Sphingomicrobium sp.]